MDLENMVVGCLIVLGIVALLALWFGLCTGIVWLICWGLNSAGVSIQFSWPLVFVFCLLTIIFQKGKE